ncbi:MAG: AI-2E family transporter [Candidatus Dormibacterales bacterium]
MGLRRSTLGWVRAAAVAVTLFVAYQLLLVVRSWLLALLLVVLYLVFGAIVALLAAPAARALERGAHVPRTLAILITLLGGLIVIGAFGYVVSGPITAEAHQLIGQVPRLVHDARGLYARLLPALRSHGIDLSPGSIASGGAGTIASELGSLLLKSVTGVLTLAVDLVVVLVVAFWLLRDGEALRTSLNQWLPARVRSAADFGIDAIVVVVGGYVRAQLFMAALIGVLSGIGMAIIGVPFPLVVALAAGLLELIPMVGPFAGAAVGVTLALTRNVPLAFETLAVFIVIHFIEGYVVGPRVQARFVRIHPLAAFLALLAGVESAGLIGALLAVPAASLLAVFVRATVGDWRANRPDLFARPKDPYLERRRRILRDFRLMRVSPGAVLRRPRLLWRLLRGGREGPPEEPQDEPRGGS